MKFKIFILLILFTGNVVAQLCGGELYFRIYDQTKSIIYPAITDTFKMNIDPNVPDAGVYKYIDHKKLPVTKLSIKTIKTEGNAGSSTISITKQPFTDLIFHFGTGCITTLKKISITKDKKKMILNLVDIPREAIILMDSIPFVDGEVTYNIEQIVRNNKECTYENLQGNKFYLHYRISYNLIKIDIPLPLTDIKEIKADTLYYYADSLKTKLIAKGKVKVLNKSFRYYDSFEHEMTKRNMVFNLKRGTWMYFYENAVLRKTEFEEKPRIKPKNHLKVGLRHEM